MVNFLLRLSQFISGHGLTFSTRNDDMKLHRDAITDRMIRTLSLFKEWHRCDAGSIVLFFILLSSIGLVGSSCDFDTKWPYEDEPCSAWNLPVDNDGEPGFRVADGTDVVGVTDSEIIVTNGPSPVHRPPKSIQGEPLYFAIIYMYASRI